jgi:hypothetical protein
MYITRHKTEKNIALCWTALPKCIRMPISIGQTEDVREGRLTVRLPREIKWNANLMQLGNFIDVFLARRVSGAYARHQGH